MEAFDVAILCFSAGCALGIIIGRQERKLERKFQFDRGFAAGIDWLWQQAFRAELERILKRGPRDVARDTADRRP